MYKLPFTNRLLLILGLILLVLRLPMKSKKTYRIFSMLLFAVLIVTAQEKDPVEDTTAPGVFTAIYMHILVVRRNAMGLEGVG